ncbi:MAG: GNAT family N-acetyltransferase [Bacteroidota bacterium]
MKLLPVELDDIQALAVIAWRAKGHWGYPKEWMENWRIVLSPDTSYIKENVVLKAEKKGEIVGWGALHFDPEQERWEIDHLWVLPEAMGQGVGKRLYQAICKRAMQIGVQKLYILSDPHARSFYEKMGAEYLAEVPSTPVGRTLPLMQVEFG